MARTFFYVCAGVFLLALSYHFGASPAGAGGVTASARLAAPTEVATLTGVLPAGATIPLPTYADGTTALESECTWIVSGARDTGDKKYYCFAADAMYRTDLLTLA